MIIANLNEHGIVLEGDRLQAGPRLSWGELGLILEELGKRPEEVAKLGGAAPDYFIVHVQKTLTEAGRLLTACSPE